MSQLSQGESEKLERLFACYEHYLLRIAEKYVGQSSCAEDIVIEAFVKVIPHLGQLNLEDGHKARNYLVTVVERLAIDFLREKPVLPLHEHLLGEYWIDEELEEAEEKKLVADAMKQLKITDAAILRLKYIQGFSNEELAEIFAISEVTVRKRLERARNRFRKILENLT